MAIRRLQLMLCCTILMMVAIYNSCFPNVLHKLREDKETIIAPMNALQVREDKETIIAPMNALQVHMLETFGHLGLKRNISRTRSIDNPRFREATRKLILSIGKTTEKYNTLKHLKEAPFSQLRNFLTSFIEDNTFRHGYLISNAEFCETHRPDLIIFISSAPEHYDRRMAIRETWGSVHAHAGLTIKTVFVLGYRTDAQVREAILQESNTYGDLIQGSFDDSYRNILTKMLFGFKWISEHCSESRYTLKSYDDMFLNIYKIVSYLNTANLTDSDLPCGQLGSVKHEMRALRKDERYTMTLTEYPFEKFPKHCTSTFNLMTTTLAMQLYAMSNMVRPFWIEDIYVTGVLTTYIGVNFIGLDRDRNILTESCTQILPKEKLVGLYVFQPFRHGEGRNKKVIKINEKEVCPETATSEYFRSNWKRLNS